MASKKRILYFLLVLGILLVGTGVGLLLFLPKPELPIAETDIFSTFDEDFAFRGKQVSFEEASKLIGARLPLPTYLPGDYAVQEIYSGVGNSTIIILISDGPIEKANREPSDKPRDYLIHEVKCKMAMYVSFVQDLRVVGGKAKPTLTDMVFDEMTSENAVWWSVESENKIASLHLIAAKEVADKEELLKFADSVK